MGSGFSRYRMPSSKNKEINENTPFISSEKSKEDICYEHPQKPYKTSWQIRIDALKSIKEKKENN